MKLGKDGQILYASNTMKLSDETLVIIDEGQDLDKVYIEAFRAITNKTCIDTYIIGDKLQI
jgi:hypothetical protein